MMFGGMFMMLFGAIALLLLIAIPVVLIVVLLARPKANGFYPSGSVVPPAQTTNVSTRTCSHCGQALQAGWSHCPNCGAPVN